MQESLINKPNRATACDEDVGEQNLNGVCSDQVVPIQDLTDVVCGDADRWHDLRVVPEIVEAIR